LNNRNPKIYLFHCATSYDQEELLKNYSSHGSEIKVVSLPCSGKLDILYLTKAFDTGADGAVILICKEGECRFLEGNMRAKKRIQAVDELLQEAGLGKGRTRIIQMGDRGISEAVHELEDFLRQIKTIVENFPPLQTSQAG